MPEIGDHTADHDVEFKSAAKPWAAEWLSDRKPPEWGGPLTEGDFRNLGASWITCDIANAALLRRVPSFEGREIVGQKGNRDCAGIVIPYYWPGDVSAVNYRIRRDNPESTTDKDGKLKQLAKYLGPPKGSNRLFIPPGVTLEQLADVQTPIALVEGEKKALALWRLAHHETKLPRFVSIAIAGVWNWRGIMARPADPKVNASMSKAPLPISAESRGGGGRSS